LKLVTAILRPEILDKVREALCDVDIPGMTVTEVKGFGKQKGHTEQYRGTEFTVDFVYKVKLEIAISTKNLDLVINVISDIARSGQKGDGKIFVSDIEKVVRIRTGETNQDAL
jgi:nitrogen regulatory protein P-II 2